MPIRFVCEHCQQRLSVSSSKVGARAKCPKCKEPIVVPQPDDDAVRSAAESIDGNAASEDAAGEYRDPFEQFMVFDDEAEFVYESDDEQASPQPELAHGAIDPNKVAIPRYVIYSQGILIGVVGLACFTFGFIVGRATSGGDSEISRGAQPCYIGGRLTFQDLDGEIISDDGAVAMVFPSDAKPEDKLEIVGLRPIDPTPADDAPTMMAIRQIGGDYTRADATGQYRLRVPDRGTYFLLFISNHKRQPDKSPAKTELAQIGRYFVLTPELFGQEDHRWTEETVKHDRTLNHVFQ